MKELWVKFKGIQLEKEQYTCISFNSLEVLRGPVVKCLIRNTGIQGPSRTRSSGFFVGVSFGKTLQSPSLVLLKLIKDMNTVSCLSDMTEILLNVT